MNTKKLLLSLSLAASFAAALPAARAGAPITAVQGAAARPTIVLVHGAFADAGSWNGVVKALSAKGYPVLSIANPLRGVASDAQYTASVLQALKGPLVLVGHSYGGMVISKAAEDNPEVKALVYVAALTPEQGETVAGKAGNFHSPERLRQDRPQQYTVGALGLNHWGLSGQWVVAEESARADQAGAGIAYQFSARDLHLVLGPGEAGRKIRIKVTLDGKAPGADHGSDIDADGNGVITDTRLYQLVRQGGKPGQRRFEIRFLDRGGEAYAFTFG